MKSEVEHKLHENLFWVLAVVYLEIGQEGFGRSE